MNEQEIATSKVSAVPAPASDIPGIARVGSIGTAHSRVAAVTAKSTPTLMGDMVAGILGRVARILNPGLIESSLTACKKAGHYAVLASAALTIVYAIYGAIKFNSFAVFAIGLGFVVTLAVGQFAAMRFLDASDDMIASTPSRTSSSAFLDCVGLLILLFAVSTLLGGIATSISARTFVPLLPAVLSTVVLTCFGAVALHPRMVNVVNGEGTAGEEAIGLLSFFFKTSLKLVPLLFLLLAVGGALTIVMSFFGEGGAFASMAQGIVNLFPLPVQVPYGLTGTALAVVACLVPILTYFLFLIQYLVVDVLRAVLSVPAKLDALRR